MHTRIMSFNIRSSYNLNQDGDNSWKNRKDYVKNLLHFYEPHIIGLQEVLQHQLDDLIQILTDYDFVGVGRLDGKKDGEYAPIFYKKNMWSLIHQGHFWLSENSDSPGDLGWDGACERVTSWCILQDELGREILCLNTHLDHVGTIARREGAKLILKKIHEILTTNTLKSTPQNNIAIALTGDFNAEPQEDSINEIKNPNYTVSLHDTREISKLVYGPQWTFHNFGKDAIFNRVIIDYIFVENIQEVLKFAVLSESNGDLYPSDHTPILADILI